jgi:hypothetical protein
MCVQEMLGNHAEIERLTSNLLGQAVVSDESGQVRLGLFSARAPQRRRLGDLLGMFQDVQEMGRLKGTDEVGLLIRELLDFVGEPSFTKDPAFAEFVAITQSRGFLDEPYMTAAARRLLAALQESTPA